MRAFRPSQFGRQDEADEEIEQAKLENLHVYAKRAQAGLPLFELVAQMPDHEPSLVKHVR